LFSLTVPQDPTNVELGGRNGKTLYITAATSLYSVALNVVPELPGDFDYDGDVDETDFAPWQASFGQRGAALDADADGDGVVNGVDFLIWQAAVDVGTGEGASAVPEPATWTLGLWAAIAAGCARCDAGRTTARVPFPTLAGVWRAQTRASS
jgi:hypothetical protein